MEESGLPWRMQKIFDRMDEHERIGKAFLSQLKADLILYVLDERPLVKQYYAEVAEQLIEIADKTARQVFDDFDLALSINSNKMNVDEYSGVRKPKTKQEAELKLKAEIAKIPNCDEEVFAEIFWESFEQEQKREWFIYKAYSKMKEVLVKYYEDLILSLDSKYLRILDSYLFTTAYNDFSDEVFVLEGKIRKLKC
ncbi:hypothetical protein [Carboxylicivirga marina]|uniref:hypothetical protein n=1 Tax=Carboxylicivirga marina TaxID=2800988 RepID=UPI002597A0F6|nr:hypothetical protein [uncultured Carboxylicivirga sp.]